MVIQFLHVLEKGSIGKCHLWVCPYFFSSVPHLVCLILMILEMGGKWPYSCCFMRCWFQDLFNIAHNILVLYSFFSICLVNIYVVHPYSRVYTTAAWKKLHFISPEKFNFHMIDNLSIIVHAFACQILMSFSVDETLLPRYMNLSTSFRETSFSVEMFLFD